VEKTFYMAAASRNMKAQIRLELSNIAKEFSDRPELGQTRDGQALSCSPVQPAVLNGGCASYYLLRPEQRAVPSLPAERTMVRHTRLIG
jgi:hypothetical protein